MIENEIIAHVSICGSRTINSPGWKYTRYVKAKNGGWRYKEDITHRMYPNKKNFLYSELLERELKLKGYKIVYGRPEKVKVIKPIKIEESVCLDFYL